MNYRILDSRDKQLGLVQQHMATYAAASARADSAGHHIHMDDGLGILQEQLRYYDPRVLRTEYEMYVYADPTGLIPHNPAQMPGVDTIQKTWMSRVGQWQLSADRSNTSEPIDVTTRNATYGAKYFECHITYSTQELDRIAFAQANGNFAPVVDLIAEKMRAVQESYTQLINETNSTGFPAIGVYGIHTHPSVSRAVSPYTLGLSRTADENIAVLTSIVNTIREVSGIVSQPDTMIMPDSLVQELNTQVRSASANISTLKFFLENNGYIKNIQPTKQATTFIQAYRRDPTRIECMIPKRMTQKTPPYIENGLYRIDFDCQVSGVHFMRPYDSLYLEGAYA